jgi:riboflavin kinase/FMN adenylyltransferase
MLISSPETAEKRERKVAIGEFDGVHLGHVAVIGDADTVLTFEPHPRAVVGPTGAPDLLTTLDQKADLIQKLGVRELVVAHFDESFSQLEAIDFVDQIVVGALSATDVRVGSNFRYGRRAKGTSESLAADSRFRTTVAELVELDGHAVSSSAIRDLIRSGDLPQASAMLGHRFEMRGVVIHGAHMGRELGCPTANVVPTDGCVVPAFGVYAALANGLPAAASLGIRPSIEDDNQVLLETHLLDWEGDLYGSEIQVELLERLRPEAKFDSLDELKLAMELDCQNAAKIAATHAR